MGMLNPTHALTLTAWKINLRNNHKSALSRPNRIPRCPVNNTVESNHKIPQGNQELLVVRAKVVR